MTTQSINPATAPKLTRWKNEPNALELQKDLQDAKPAHDAHVLKVSKWNDLLRAEGKAKAPKVKGRSSVQPKLIRRQAEWRYSALSEPFHSSQQPFDVKPVSFEDAEAARQNKTVLNWQFKTKINRVKFIDDYVRANVDEGSAIVRLGWTRVTKMVEEEVPVWDLLEPQSKEEVDALEAAIRLQSENPRFYDEQVPPAVKQSVEYFHETGMPTVAVENGTTKQRVEKVIDNRPLVQVLNPKNVWFDPSCGGDIDAATFAIVSFETSKAELKKEPNRYKNLDHVNWQAAATNYDNEHRANAEATDGNFNFSDELRRRVVAYEYWGLWDIGGNGELVQIVATWVAGTLIRCELNPFPDQKIPIVVVNYMPTKRELLGEPDAELLEDNQAVLGAVTRGMIDLLGRSANSQQGFAKGMLDPLNRRKYENGQDYEFNPNAHPTNGLMEHRYPEIPQSGLLMAQMMNQEAEALTGVKAFSGGISGEAYGDVAAGIRGVLDAASKREMAILRRLAKGLETIARKIISMNQAFLSDEETVRITNEQFVTVKREDLQGEFDLECDISTAEIDNAKAQDLSFMLQTMGPNGDFAITKMILVEIAMLKRMYELADRLRKFEPKPDPLAEALKQAEIVKLQKEAEKLQSEIDLNEAKIEVQLATAAQIRLNAVEQETGTAHARGIEAAGAQAAANKDLEVTKALLKPKKQADGSESKPDVEAAVGWNQLSKEMSDPRAGNVPQPEALPGPDPVPPAPIMEQPIIPENQMIM